MFFFFLLVVCVEMFWQDQLIDWCVVKFIEMGFGVGFWNWLDYDLDKLEKVGVNYIIMNGYFEGCFVDDEGVDMLIVLVCEIV